MFADEGLASLFSSNTILQNSAYSSLEPLGAGSWVLLFGRHPSVHYVPHSFNKLSERKLIDICFIEKHQD